jgi:hypothetical protein
MGPAAFGRPGADVQVSVIDAPVLPPVVMDAAIAAAQDANRATGCTCIPCLDVQVNGAGAIRVKIDHARHCELA